MKDFQLMLGGAVAACLVMAVAFGGSAPPRVRSSPPAAEPARMAGGKIYGKWCADCHGTAEAPGSRALERRHKGSPPAVLEQRNDLSPDDIKKAVRSGDKFMPSFRKTEISDAELALVTTYLTPAK
jgi:mono/diheme cytochrome c family protein